MKPMPEGGAVKETKCEIIIQSVVLPPVRLEKPFIEKDISNNYAQTTNYIQRIRCVTNFCTST